MSQMPRCPHCEKVIELLSAGDLKAKYGIGPNALQHAREKGAFPEAWIVLPNRNLWLDSSIREYAEAKGRAKVEELAMATRKALAALPPGQADAAREMLQKELEALPSA